MWRRVYRISLGDDLGPPYGSLHAGLDFGPIGCPRGASETTRLLSSWLALTQYVNFDGAEDRGCRPPGAVGDQARAPAGTRGSRSAGLCQISRFVSGRGVIAARRSKEVQRLEHQLPRAIVACRP